MAITPYFVLSPNTLMSIAGLIHGPDKTVPTPAEDWKGAVVDVVIPALNEEQDITLCLASILRQTMRPRRIILIDDGGTDRTTEYAKAFCETNAMELVAIKRKAPIGKTPTIKRQAREFDPDVEFVLDADTVLESDNYIERTVQELYQGIGIASACGTILPLRERDRKALIETPAVRKFRSLRPDAPLKQTGGLFHRIKKAITNAYRGALYMFLQRFVYHGQMVFFGTITNPVGCAVAYRRKYVKDVFDRYEPVLGDHLTNSEDIFLGFAMLDKGYRNVQLTDVYARSEEPEATRLPGQLYMWSSSFFQCCYYFDSLLRSPCKAFRRYRRQQEERKFETGSVEKRKIREQYRQPFGEDYTKAYGRPMGWLLFSSLAEKVFFPTTFLIMIILGLWWPLAVTVVAETLISVAILTIVAQGHRAEYFAKGLVVTPVRYSALLYDFYVMMRFASDLWIFRSRRWKK